MDSILYNELNVGMGIRRPGGHSAKQCLMHLFPVLPGFLSVCPYNPTAGVSHKLFSVICTLNYSISFVIHQ